MNVNSVGALYIAARIQTTKKSPNFFLLASCIFPKAVGYKIVTNNPENYTVTPNRGVVHPHHIEKIAFESQPNGATNPDDKFVMTILVWPNASNAFDRKIWDNIDDSKDKQTITLNALSSSIPHHEIKPEGKAQQPRKPIMQSCMQQTSKHKDLVSPPVARRDKPSDEKQYLDNKNASLQLIVAKPVQGDPGNKLISVSSAIKQGRTCKKSASLIIKCLSSKPIAFKIQSEESTWASFTVNPGAGVINPGLSQTVDFKVAEDSNREIYGKCKPQFCVFAMNWPETISQYDPKTWDCLKGMVKSGLIASPVIIDIKWTAMINEVAVAEAQTGNNKIGESNPEPQAQARHKGGGAQSNRAAHGRVKSTEPKTAPEGLCRPPVGEAKSKQEGRSVVSPSDSSPNSPKGPGQTEFIQCSNSKLCFIGSNSKRQSNTLKISNMNANILVAFKVQSNHADVYSVFPARQVLKPKTFEIVNIELKENFTESDFKKAEGLHKFHITAIRWPKSAPSFDMALWKKLVQEKKKETQMITIDVNFL